MYDEIEVEQVDPYNRRHVGEGSVQLKIKESKSQKWETLEDAEKHQPRETQITLDRVSVDTLISLLETTRDNPTK
jgi:hypothetical protein